MVFPDMRISLLILVILQASCVHFELLVTADARDGGDAERVELHVPVALRCRKSTQALTRRNAARRGAT